MCDISLADMGTTLKGALIHPGNDEIIKCKYLHDCNEKFVLNGESLGDSSFSSNNNSFIQALESNLPFEKESDLKKFVSARINQLCINSTLEIDKIKGNKHRKSTSLVNLNSSYHMEDLPLSQICFKEINMPSINSSIENTTKNTKISQDFENFLFPITNENTSLRRTSSFNSISGRVLKRESWVDDAGDDLLTMAPCWDDSIPSEDEMDEWGLPKLKLTPRKQSLDHSVIDEFKKKLVRLSFTPKEHEVDTPLKMSSTAFNKEPEILSCPSEKCNININQEQILEPLRPVVTLSRKVEATARQKGPLKACAPIKNMIKKCETRQIIATLPKRPRRSGSVPKNMNSSLNGSYNGKVPIGASTPIISKESSFRPSRRDNSKIVKTRRSVSASKT